MTILARPKLRWSDVIRRDMKEKPVTIEAAYAYMSTLRH